MSNSIELEITRIKKDNGDHYDPYEAVEAYEWYQPSSSLRGVASREKMVSWLDNGYKGQKVVAYVEQVKPRAYCYVNQHGNGPRFLQTRADAVKGNNLLELPPIL